MSLIRLAFGLQDEAIQGLKVSLRRPRNSDFEEWANLRMASRAFLEKWEPTWSEDEFSRRAFRQRVAVYAERAERDEGHSFFIFSKDTSALLGGINLMHIKRGACQSATLGYWMGEAHAGRGHMKDSLLAICGAARPRFDLHRLEAACLPRNEASRRLLRACGFVPEGLAKSYVKIAGVWEDHLLFGRVVD